MNRSILTLAASFALAGGAHAVVLVDDFEDYGPLFGDMNLQGGWTVTNGNPANVLDGPVVIVDAYTWDASTQSATVGGVEQTAVGVTTLSHTLSVPLQSVSGWASSFSFETAYTESDNGFRNPFSVVFGTDFGGGNLLTIDFTPGAAGEYDVSWSSGFAAGGAIGPLTANISTQFQLDTYWNGSNVAYDFTNAGTPVSSGTFVSLNATDLVDSFSVNWDSSVGGGVGNNSITIDNVIMVPEPTSAMLGLLGASCVFLRRRRA